jgi:uncharacterized OB-fold protein
MTINIINYCEECGLAFIEEMSRCPKCNNEIKEMGWVEYESKR